MLSQLVYLLIIVCFLDLVKSKSVLVNVNVPTGRIVGGESTTIEEFPYQVSLRYKGSHFCGGSIINERLILTAAHCVSGYSSKDLEVGAGSTVKTEELQIIPVHKIILHEQWTSQTVENDIALIVLSKNLTFGNTLKPIALPSFGETLKDRTPVFITGWGLTSEHETEGPKALQFAIVEIINQRKCFKAYRKAGSTITPKMLCAGTEKGDRDTCQQDSGGPLSFENKLIGIASWGMGCGRAGYPGVYTRVATYRQWIDENIVRALGEISQQ